MDARHPELDEAERAEIANSIGVGALRYFMLRFTRNTVIAFDFRDALSFEGETGPYAQYAAVRAANIFRKGEADEAAVLREFEALDASALAPLLEGEDGTSVWEVWLAASRVSLVLEQAIAAAEPAVLAKYAFTLAQSFNNFYHRHRVLTESDPARKTLLFATAAVARREITRVLGGWESAYRLRCRLRSWHEQAKRVGHELDAHGRSADPFAVGLDVNARFGVGAGEVRDAQVLRVWVPAMCARPAGCEPCGKSEARGWGGERELECVVGRRGTACEGAEEAAEIADANRHGADGVALDCRALG